MQPIIILCLQQCFFDALRQGFGVPRLIVAHLNAADHLFDMSQTLTEEDPLFSQQPAITALPISAFVAYDKVGYISLFQFRVNQLLSG
jgi:hypothetical protein